MSFTFCKAERLKSKKTIERLFNKEGQSFAKYPLRIIWLEMPLNTPFPAQFAVSVPKRRFKSAVKRNRIKRKIRETYRLQKHLLYDFLEKEEKQYAIIVLYTANEELPYKDIDKRMRQIIRRLIT
ncbi:MAG: ribonuclease P protein component [Saprospiraceae bacterium]